MVGGDPVLGRRKREKIRVLLITLFITCLFPKDTKLSIYTEGEWDEVFETRRHNP